MEYKTVFLILLSLLVEVKLDSFPYECQISDVFLFICESDQQNLTNDSCQNLSKSKVKIIRYTCKSYEAEVLYLDQIRLYRDFNAANVLDISKLGINKFDLNLYFTQPYEERADYNIYSITKLIASHNSLKIIDISILAKMPNLIEIDYSYNKIENFTFQPMYDNNKILIVNCSHNHISGFELGRSNVIVLDLSWNTIDTLKASMLQQFGDLQYLNLSNSKISKIENHLHFRLYSLKSLDLSNNLLNDINYVIFKSAWLEDLNLAGNKLSKIYTIHSDNLRNLKSLEIANNNFDRVHLFKMLDEWVKNGLKIDVEISAPTTTTIEKSNINISKFTSKITTPTMTEMPKINASNFNNGAIWKVELSHTFNLTCDFSGVPQPKLNWYKYENDEKKELKFKDSDHKSLLNDGKMLRLASVTLEDEGTYECEAKYGHNSDQRSVTIQISKGSSF